jgi:phage gpG-like protein
MSVFRVECNITGSDIAKQKLFKIESRVKDFSKPFQIINTLFEEYQRQAFESEGSATGRAWAKLSNRYQWWKSKHFPGKGILEATGKMKGSLVSTNAYTKKVIEPLVFTRGTNLNYSSFLQGGTGDRGVGISVGTPSGKMMTMPSRGMPARPFIRMQKVFWDKVTSLLEYWIKAGE